MTDAARTGEAGWTLIELLVVMVLSVVILTATLNSLDVFSTETTQQSLNVEANEQVRTTMDRTVRDLRGASTILRATATDLAYVVPETTGFRTERICLDGAGLYGSSTTSASTPVAPSDACANGTLLARGTGTSFTYDGAATASTPQAVKNVGLAFGLEADGKRERRTKTLRASAAVRRTTATVPVDPGDVVVACSQAGTLVSLGAGVAYDDAIGPLTVSFTNEAGTSVAGGTLTPSQPTVAVTLPPRAAGADPALATVTARITDAFGVVRGTISKAIPCVP